MTNKRTGMILLAAVGLAILAIAAYFLFFAGTRYVEGRPTFKYFRLET